MIFGIDARKRRVAEALEASLGDNRGERIGELATHWLAATRSADLDKAVDDAQRAGDRPGASATSPAVVAASSAFRRDGPADGRCTVDPDPSRVSWFRHGHSSNDPPPWHALSPDEQQ